MSPIFFGKSMSITIRNFIESKDSETFLRLSFETLVNIQGLPPGISRDEYFETARSMVLGYIKELHDNQILVAESSEGIYAGHIWFSLKDEVNPWDTVISYWIHNITVKKEQRHCGIGNFLMEFAENWAIQQGATLIGLHVNQESNAARRLYLQRNYTDQITQWKKILNLHSPQVSIPFQILTFNPSNCEESLENLIFQQFRKKNGSISDEIRQLTWFHTYYQKEFLETKERQFFILRLEEGQIEGFIVLTEGEQRYEKCLRIVNIGTSDTIDQKKYAQVLLNFAENWAKIHKIAIIMLEMHHNMKEWPSILEQEGFSPIGFYMYKNIKN